MILEILKNKFARKKKEHHNYHLVLIEAPESVVGPEIMLWGEASWWPKKCNMRFTRKTSGKLGIGTEYEQKVLPFGPRWDVRVTKLNLDREIERTFLNGMFTGRESVSVEGRYNGTKVNYNMYYSITSLMDKLLWAFVFRRRHDQNIEMILKALKDHVTKQVETAKDAKE